MDGRVAILFEIHASEYYHLICLVVLLRRLLSLNLMAPSTDWNIIINGHSKPLILVDVIKMQII